MKRSYFKWVGEAFLWALEQHLEQAWTPAVNAAWTAVYRLMMKYMLQGLSSQRRMRTNPSLATGNGQVLDPYLSIFLSPQKLTATKITSAFDNTGKGGKSIQLNYDGETLADGLSLQTILEISRNNSIPHISECGGNAKCSTCRVSIDEGLENCLPRNRPEAILAQHKNFPPNIRLACQTKVIGPVKLKRLVLDQTDLHDAVKQGNHAIGREMQLAILFADVRAFTGLTETHLPYDVVHMLNRYYNAIGVPIHENYGYIDKYMGDGIMVLFGLNPSRPVHPCVDAVNAALGMLTALNTVNDYFDKYFHQKFFIGIGIHFGQVIVGEIGFQMKKEFTALGDVVNVAARIEAQTKQYQTALLISSTVRAQLPESQCVFGRTLEVTLSGKTGSYVLHEIVP